MYKMSEFCSMVGMSKSKVRFYEKKGLFKTKREENGYRAFSPSDAFRVNSFLTLLQYGLSVEEAIEMLDKQQSGADFIQVLQNQQKEIEHQKQVLEYREKRIERTLRTLSCEDCDSFEIKVLEDRFYAHASHGLDFTPAVDNSDILEGLYACIFASHCCRLISVEEIFSNLDTVNPSYINALPVSDVRFLEGYDTSKLKRLELGKSLVYTRKKTREESAKRDSFVPMIKHMEENGLRPRGNILFLMPSFLNLDEKGSDVEVLILPIE